MSFEGIMPEKITISLIERLEAVLCIVSTECDAESAKCAYDELQAILDSMQHDGYIKTRESGRWFEKIIYLVPIQTGNVI